MNQKIKLVKPNRAVITRTVMPPKPEPLHYKALSYAETIVASIMVGLAIAFVIAVIGITTGCTSLVADQFEQDIATSTIAPRLSQTDSDDQLIEFRRQSEYASQTLAAMRAYAEGGIQ